MTQISKYRAKIYCYKEDRWFVVSGTDRKSAALNALMKYHTEKGTLLRDAESTVVSIKEYNTVDSSYVTEYMLSPVYDISVRDIKCLT